MRTARVSIVLEGESVLLDVDRLTVAAFNAAAALAYPRGAKTAERDEVFVDRIACIDRALRPAPGAIETDDPARGLASLYAGQPPIVAQLYDVLLDAQTTTQEERAHLRIAARFSRWLSDAQRRQVESHWTATGTSCEACHARRLCEKRGCDGTAKKKVVWHDGPIVLKTCPVLSFTPDVEWALRTFYWSHDVVMHGPSATWMQTRLVRAGGLDDQEAWLTSALGVLRSVHAQMTREQRTEGPADD